MATSVEDCVNMLRDVTQESMEGKVFAIGHVMRYSPYNVAIKEIIDSGVLGDIVDLQVSDSVSAVAKTVAHGTSREPALCAFVRSGELGK